MSSESAILLTATAVSAESYRQMYGGNMGDSIRETHLSPADLAEREGVPLETIYAWNRTGAGPRYMRIGRHVRYRLADVIRWEDSRLVTSRTA